MRAVRHRRPRDAGVEAHERVGGRRALDPRGPPSRSTVVPRSREAARHVSVDGQLGLRRAGLRAASPGPPARPRPRRAAGSTFSRSVTPRRAAVEHARRRRRPAAPTVGTRRRRRRRRRRVVGVARGADPVAVAVDLRRGRRDRAGSGSAGSCRGCRGRSRRRRRCRTTSPMRSPSRSAWSGFGDGPAVVLGVEHAVAVAVDLAGVADPVAVVVLLRGLGTIRQLSSLRRVEAYSTLPSVQSRIAVVVVVDVAPVAELVAVRVGLVRVAGGQVVVADRPAVVDVVLDEVAVPVVGRRRDRRRRGATHRRRPPSSARAGAAAEQPAQQQRDRKDADHVSMIRRAGAGAPALIRSLTGAGPPRSCARPCRCGRP